MAFPEEYYIDIRGEQRGPYSFPQLKRMYDTNLIPEEALYWQDGLEHWQPVADLCGVQRRDRLRLWRQLRGVGLAALVIGALATGYCAPIVREGWREMDEQGYTAKAAYWRARGFVRSQAKDQGASVVFDAFSAPGVTLQGGTAASVTLPGTLYPASGPAVHTTWKVSMVYRPERREWTLPQTK